MNAVKCYYHQVFDQSITKPYPTYLFLKYRLNCSTHGGRVDLAIYPRRVGSLVTDGRQEA